MIFTTLLEEEDIDQRDFQRNPRTITSKHGFKTQFLSKSVDEAEFDTARRILSMDRAYNIPAILRASPISVYSKPV